MISWLTHDEFAKRLSQESVLPRGASRAVAEIVEQVRRQGDSAIVALARRFDAEDFEASELVLEPRPTLSGALARHMEKAAEAIEAFARATMPRVNPEAFPPGTGVRFVPVKRAAVYAPGGLAPYFSTVLMGVIPAVVAGVEEVFVLSPPRVSEVILHAAWVAGAKAVFQVGGAQAIAGVALGTETLPKVDIVAGPGNIYVQEAKRQLWGVVGVDTLAGPSEVCVVADESADPRFVAWELMAQAEHDALARAYPVVLDNGLCEEINRILVEEVPRSPRYGVTEAALRASFGAVATDLGEAARLVDAVAPEHTVVLTRDPEAFAAMIVNSGALFLGPWSPVAAGDYMAGPSHILPTGRWAVFSSGLNPGVFLRAQAVISWSRSHLRESAPAIVGLADAEGFWAHGKSVEVRLDRA